MNDQTHAMLDEVAAYALGVLPAAQAAEVRAHMAGCTICQEEYAELSAAASMVGAVAEPADARACPSDLLKPRIMQIVRADAARASDRPAPRAERSPVWPAYMVAAACFAIALISSIANIALSGQLRTAQNELARLSSRSSDLARNLQGERQMLADLLGSDAKRYAVTGGDIVTRGSHVYIAMHDLPEPPRGKVYQAWTLAKNAKKVAPSVTFVPDEHGAAVIAIPIDARATAAVAVSVEPEGGSKAPTTKPVIVVPLT